MNKQDLDAIIVKHGKWMLCQRGGSWADLRRANLSLQRARQANRMKSLGMVPGVVDIICLIPRNGHPFAAWECKAPGRRPS